MRNHFWVHRKANTIKRGWRIKMNWLLKCSEPPKILSHSPTKHFCPEPHIQNRCHQVFRFGPTDFQPRHNPSQTYHFGTTDSASVLPSLGDQLSVASVHKIGILEFGYECHQVVSSDYQPPFLCHRVVYIGSTEIQKLLPLVQVGTNELMTSVSPSLSL